jgi:HTH-type transcriptional regulator / antitoxin HigA
MLDLMNVNQNYGLSDPGTSPIIEELPHPVEAIKDKMKELNLTEEDMVKYIGKVEDVVAILNKRMMITIKMILELHRGLEIPINILVQDYPLYYGD